jgi:hypothetical protein
MYLPELPLLEMTARDFEGQPGIRERVAAAAQAELVSPELKDEWQLGKQREEPMGSLQPAVEERGIDMNKYVEWAPIEGYNYDDVLRLKTIQPGTPLQQRGEALAGASRENSQEGSPNPGPLLLTDGPANEDQLLTAVNEALPSAGLQAPAQHVRPPAHPKPLAPAALDKSPDAPADGGAAGEGLPKDIAGSASELSDGGESQETLVQVESGDSGVGQKKKGGGARKRKVREGMGGAPMDGRNAAGGAGPELAAESIGAAVRVGLEKGESRGGLGKAKKNKGVRSASEKRRRKTVLVSSDDSGEVQEAEPNDQAAEIVSKDVLGMLATSVRDGQVLTMDQLSMVQKVRKVLSSEGGSEGRMTGRLLAFSKKQKLGPPAAILGGPDVRPGEKDTEKVPPRLTEQKEPREGGPPAEPGTEVLVGSRQTEEEQGAGPEERAQGADDAPVEERQQEAPGGSAAVKPLEVDLGHVPTGKLVAVSTLEVAAICGSSEAKHGEANGRPGGAVEMEGEGRAGGGETVPQPESQRGLGTGVELDDDEKKQPGKDADKNGVSQEEVPGTSVATEREGRGDTDIADGEARVLAAYSAKLWPDAGKSVTARVAGADGMGLDKREPEVGGGNGPGREEEGAAASQGGLQAAGQEAYSAGGARLSVQGASADLEMVRSGEEMRDAAAPPGFNVALQHPDQGLVVTDGKQNIWNKFRVPIDFLRHRLGWQDEKVPDCMYQESVEQMRNTQEGMGGVEVITGKGVARHQRVGPENEVGLGHPALGGGHGPAQWVRGFPLLEQGIPGGDIFNDGSALHNVNAVPEALMRRGNSVSPAEGVMGSSVAVEEGLPSRTEVRKRMEAATNAYAYRRGALGGSVGESAEEERAPLGEPAGRAEVLGAAVVSQEGDQGKTQRAARKARLVRDRQQRSQNTAAAGGGKLLQREGGHAGKEGQSSALPVPVMRGRVEPRPGGSIGGVTGAATASIQNLAIAMRGKLCPAEGEMEGRKTQQGEQVKRTERDEAAQSEAARQGGVQRLQKKLQKKGADGHLQACGGAGLEAQGRFCKATDRQGRVQQSGGLNLEPIHSHLKIGLLGAQLRPPKGPGFDLSSHHSAQMA